MNNRKIAAGMIVMLIATTLACTIPVNFAPAPEVEEKIVYIEITAEPTEEEEEVVEEEE